jgi:hypothetical protein
MNIRLHCGLLQRLFYEQMWAIQSRKQLKKYIKWPDYDQSQYDGPYKYRRVMLVSKSSNWYYYSYSVYLTVSRFLINQIKVLHNNKWSLTNIYLQLGPSWPWTYHSLIDDYLYNRCLSLLTLWVRIQLRRVILDTTICDRSWFWPSCSGPLVLLLPKIFSAHDEGYSRNASCAIIIQIYHLEKFYLKTVDM